MTCQCNRCGDDIDSRRYALGYRTCLWCGEEEARLYKHTIVPIHKSSYTVITDMSLLVGINNKGGLVK